MDYKPFSIGLKTIGGVLATLTLSWTSLTTTSLGHSWPSFCCFGGREHLRCLLPAAYCLDLLGFLAY
jgi:hypothetical protein